MLKSKVSPKYFRFFESIKGKTLIDFKWRNIRVFNILVRGKYFLTLVKAHTIVYFMFSKNYVHISVKHCTKKMFFIFK